MNKTSFRGIISSKDFLVKLIFLLITTLIATVGFFIKYYFFKEPPANPKILVYAKQDQLLPVVCKIKAHYIKITNDLYFLGIHTSIVQRDNTKAAIVDCIFYNGGFRIEGDGVCYKNFKFYDLSGPVVGNFVLAPGRETNIKFNYPHTVQMSIVPGGTPKVVFTGMWYIVIEGIIYPIPFENIETEKVLTNDEWLNLDKVS